MIQMLIYKDDYVISAFQNKIDRVLGKTFDFDNKKYVWIIHWIMAMSTLQWILEMVTSLVDFTAYQFLLRNLMPNSVL